MLEAMPVNAKSSLVPLEVSIVIPCLNEAETIQTVVSKAVKALDSLQIVGEVIVADNGSTDNSRQLASDAGARVVPVPQRGYGAALRGGIAAAQGQYIIMGDADDSYDFGAIEPFIHKLREGYNLVMGTRLKGKILPGAMPFLHRWLGNPFLTWLGNVLLKAGVSDYHCGLRGFNREAINRLNLRTSGMEFASEMVAKAALNHYSIAEVPIIYYPDGRSRRPHLRTWRDGWRHLKFLLLLSPYYTFIVPGLVITLLSFGVLTGSVVLNPFPLSQPNNANLAWLMGGSLGVIFGFQVLIFGLISRLYAVRVGLLPHKPVWDRLAIWLGLDNGLVIGALVIVSALVLIGAALSMSNFNLLVIGMLLVVLGTQLMFLSFVLALFKMQENFD